MSPRRSKLSPYHISLTDPELDEHSYLDNTRGDEAFLCRCLERFLERGAKSRAPPLFSPNFRTARRRDDILFSWLGEGLCWPRCEDASTDHLVDQKPIKHSAFQRDAVKIARYENPDNDRM